MGIRDLFGGRRQSLPATGYRFGDFTRGELVLIRSLLQREMLELGDQLKRAVCEGTKKEIAERGQDVAMLYDEVNAALLKSMDDERRQWGWWK
jgi:hypothetical protein